MLAALPRFHPALEVPHGLVEISLAEGLGAAHPGLFRRDCLRIGRIREPVNGANVIAVLMDHHFGLRATAPGIHREVRTDPCGSDIEARRCPGIRHVRCGVGAPLRAMKAPDFDSLPKITVKIGPIASAFPRTGAVNWRVSENAVGAKCGPAVTDVVSSPTAFTQDADERFAAPYI